MKTPFGSRTRMNCMKPLHRLQTPSNKRMGDGSGFSRGVGMGRGMGGCRGQGRGMGLSGTRMAQGTGSGIRSQDQEMEDLKQQAGRLNEKMKEVISRINRLENSKKH